MASLPEYLVPTFMEAEAINHYLEIQSSFIPAPGFYSNPENRDIRRLAVSIIAKNWTRENSDAFVPYLAMNYFDRFASRNPNSDAKVPLVAICCLTLASKMRTMSFSLDTIPRQKYNFEPNTIKRMELRILNGLEWQMWPVTPFCFLDHIYPSFLPIGGFKRRCINQIIVQAQGEMEFIGHDPYDFAVACFLAAILIWDRRKFPSIEIRGEQSGDSRLHYDLADFCRRKNIRIECIQWTKGCSSSATAATVMEPDQQRPEGMDTSEGIAAADIGTVSGQQRPEETDTSEGNAAADIETETCQQRPEETETSEEIAAADIGTESGQQRSEGMDTSEGIAAADIGTVSGQQRPEETDTSEGNAAADIETETCQQRPEETETSEGIAAADIGTESGQQRSEGTETSEGITAADIGTESGQQGPEVAEISEEFAVADTGTVLGQQGPEALPRSPEDVPSETEAEKQRRLDRGKAVCEIVEAEDEDEDGEDILGQFFQKMLKRVEISNQGIGPAAEAESPRRLMDFDLTWPTDDPFIDEPRTPTIRHPTMKCLCRTYGS